MKKKDELILYIVCGVLLIGAFLWLYLPIFDKAGADPSTEAALTEEMAVPTEEAIEVPMPEEEPEPEVSIPVTVDKKDEFLLKQDGQVVTDDEGLRYITVARADENGKADLQYIEIPSVSDEIELIGDNITVYSKADASLYSSAALKEKVRFTTKGEKFTRVGRTEDATYQLVDEKGNIVYAHGWFFLRFNEIINTTEVIDLPLEEFNLDVDIINQYPDMPNGCEITSLTMVLNYLGYYVTKEEMSDFYLPKAPVGKSNYYYEFVGNPKMDNAYGCYPEAIVNAANSFFTANGIEYRAYDYTGHDFEDLLLKLKDGIPIVIWTAYHMETESYFTSQWIVDGEFLPWKANMHCVVLTGYDTENRKVFIANPAGSHQSIDMDLFIKRFKQFYSQAVVIE